MGPSSFVAMASASRRDPITWVRKSGVPLSTSSVEAGGHGRVDTRVRALVRITSRFASMNWCSMPPPFP